MLFVLGAQCQRKVRSAAPEIRGSAWSERPFMNSLLLRLAEAPLSWGPHLWGL
jgi:hypothetical protein